MGRVPTSGGLRVDDDGDWSTRLSHCARLSPTTRQSGSVADDQFNRLLDFTRRLSAAGLHFRLTRFRAESICVEVHVPGDTWEVEIMHDGTVEVERFRSSGDIDDEAALATLFRDFAD